MWILFQRQCGRNQRKWLSDSSLPRRATPSWTGRTDRTDRTAPTHGAHGAHGVPWRHTIAKASWIDQRSKRPRIDAAFWPRSTNWRWWKPWIGAVPARSAFAPRLHSSRFRHSQSHSACLVPWSTLSLSLSLVVLPPALPAYLCLCIYTLLLLLLLRSVRRHEQRLIDILSSSSSATSPRPCSRSPSRPFPWAPTSSSPSPSSPSPSWSSSCCAVS